MEEATEITTKKPEVGAWDNMMAYPKKVKFESGTPVVVTFGKTLKSQKKSQVKMEPVYFMYLIVCQIWKLE